MNDPVLGKRTNCGRSITPANQSPEPAACDECFIYLQDIRYEDVRERYVTVTREMAIDAGCPELEGAQWLWW